MSATIFTVSPVRTIAQKHTGTSARSLREDTIIAWAWVQKLTFVRSKASGNESRTNDVVSSFYFIAAVVVASQTTRYMSSHRNDTSAARVKDRTDFWFTVVVKSASPQDMGKRVFGSSLMLSSFSSVLPALAIVRFRVLLLWSPAESKSFFTGWWPSQRGWYWFASWH